MQEYFFPDSFIIDLSNRQIRSRHSYFGEWNINDTEAPKPAVCNRNSEISELYY